MTHLCRSLILSLVSLLAGLSLLAMPVTAQIRALGLSTTMTGGYSLTDLGTLGGTTSTPTAIDSIGNVVGYASTADGDTHAFYYDILSGLMTDLGTLGGSASQANAISDSGTITGAAMLADSSYHAFSYANGLLTDLGALDTYNTDGYSFGQAIDSNDTIVGYSHTANGDHGFLYSAGTLTDLGIDASAVYAYSLNDGGTVTGGYNASGMQHAFTFSNGVVADLGTLGGPTSTGQHVNQLGDIVGVSDTLGLGGAHAFLYTQGFMTDLGTLGGSTSSALWLNNAGFVTGGSLTVGDVEQHAFLFDGTQMTDLNQLVSVMDPLASFVTLQQGVAINDNGTIAAIGIDSRTGLSHAYLVQPTFIMFRTTTQPEIFSVASASGDGSSSGGGGALGLLELGSFLALVAGRRLIKHQPARKPA